MSRFNYVKYDEESTRKQTELKEAFEELERLAEVNLEGCGSGGRVVRGIGAWVPARIRRDLHRAPRKAHCLA